MKIKSIHLTNFKRFTNLEIANIPETCKLVILIGPNGCGKSSLFDGLLTWYSAIGNFGNHGDEKYSRKSVEVDFNWQNSVAVQFYGDVQPTKGSLYVRSAYRNDPNFSMSNISAPESPEAHMRFRKMIDNDQTVGLNFQRLVYESTSALYSEVNDQRTVKELRQELVGEIQASMRNVFGDLELLNISDPLGNGTFTFRKGTSNNFQYQNLSGGEKSEFDLLLDIHLKKRHFPNAVYCIDEIETHLHTRVQGLILKEIIKVLPETCQMWCTTHSLGVIRAAQAIEATTPNSVCMISFDGVTADEPSVVTPLPMGRKAWEKMLSITLDDLSRSVAPKVMVVCEGSRSGKRRIDFDASVLDTIFSKHVADVQFVSGGNCLEVPKNAEEVRSILKAVIPDTKIIAVMDRDDQSEQEVLDAVNSGAIVLSHRNLESYLLADDVIERFLSAFGKNDKLNEALTLKGERLQASVSRGNAPDDLKSAAGEIVNYLKTAVGQPRLGNNTDSFLRDTMAKFITPDTETYKQLKIDLIDKL